MQGKIKRMREISNVISKTAMPKIPVVSRAVKQTEFFALEYSYSSYE